MEKLTKIERTGIVSVIVIAALVIGVTAWRNRPVQISEAEKRESAEQLERFKADVERFEADTIAKKKKKGGKKKKRKLARQVPAVNPLNHKIEKDE